MPKKVFGSIEKALGSQVASVDEFHLLETPLSCSSTAHVGHEVVQCSLEHADRVADFCRRVRGDVYVQVEQLASDFELNQVNQLYRQAGLSRYRRIGVAMNRFGQIVAALLVYRGPLGLNFSFLENRADLLLCPEASDEDTAKAVQNLVSAASRQYRDFAPGYMPVIACDRGARLLEQQAQR